MSVDRIAAKLAGVRCKTDCAYPLSGIELNGREYVRPCDCDRPQRQAALVERMIEAAGLEVALCAIEDWGEQKPARRGTAQERALAAALEVDDAD